MPTALVTGVSRRVGIGWTVAERLIRAGWSPHDEAQPWGGDSSAPDLANLSWLPEDLADPDAPSRLVARHVAQHGRLDALVAVHARSSLQDLATVTATELDASFVVNT